MVSPTQRMISFLTNVFKRFSTNLTNHVGNIVDEAPRIGTTIGSILAKGSPVVFPANLAEKICNFVALQAMTRYRSEDWH